MSKHVQIAIKQGVSSPIYESEYERKDLPSGGHTETYHSFEVGTRRGDIVVMVDIEALVQLKGGRALRAGKHVATVADKAIILKAINIKDTMHPTKIKRW